MLNEFLLLRSILISAFGGEGAQLEVLWAQEKHSDLWLSILIKEKEQTIFCFILNNQQKAPNINV